MDLHFLSRRVALCRHFAQESQLAKKPAARAEFVLFDVTYEDGSRRSNRRVPSNILGGLDGDEPARATIEEQDREIAEKSGQPPLRIKSLQRSGGKK
ncbi:MAG: hypothetical protein RL735_1702 [Pseudomonadota bacterium]|jgi:hypothetical protein